MNEDQFPIRWNIQKKEERDDQTELDKVKRIVQEVYLRWQKLFLTKKVTIEEMPKHFNDLRSQIVQKLKQEKLTPYREFTEQLIDEVAKRLDAFVRSQDPEQPNWLLPSTPHAHPVPFHSEQELAEIGIVADHFGHQDFVGLLLKIFNPAEIELLAAFQDGDKDLKTVCIGRLASLKGVRKLPTLREYVAHLAHERASKATAAKAPESPSPEPPAHPSDPTNPATGDSTTSGTA